MSDINMIDLIESLRIEMRGGFDRVIDKIDEHVKDDAVQFTELNTRTTATETKQNIVMGILGSIGVALLGWFTIGK